MSDFYEQASHLKVVFDKLKKQLQAQNEEIERLKTARCDPEAIIQTFTDQLIPIFAQMIDMRLGLSLGDTNKICKLAKYMGRALNLRQQDLYELNNACWLHNIGLIGLKDDVITTPYNKLTPEQRQSLDSSPLKAEALLISIPQFKNIAHIIRHQYERYDGKGYPDQLFAQNIPICSRIMTIAVDFYELQNGIFFGESIEFDEAYEYILKGAYKNYDPKVIEAFKNAIKEIPHTTHVSGRELTLKSDTVEAGMVLTESLNIDNEIVLLGAGQILTDSLIDRVVKLEKKLGKRFLFHVERDELEDDTSAANALEDTATTA